MCYCLYLYSCVIVVGTLLWEKWIVFSNKIRFVMAKWQLTRSNN